jgi:queuine tRNA-ribosyltransferase
MQMTHRRARRAFEYFQPKYDEARGVLFPIVQGGSYTDLRQESVKVLSVFAWDGIAIGGVAVGEEKEKIQEVVAFTTPKLPVDKPRYLMGVGTPEDLKFAIEQGVDMFDCVSATRYGRHGIVFSDEGNIKISNARYASDFSLLTPTCDCYACRNFTKAYFHHLQREKEMLGGILMGLHNIVYLNKILSDWRNLQMNTI